MPRLKFNHVFFGLMLLSILSAFVFSAPVGDLARSQVANIFAPVAWPVNRIGGWVYRAVARPGVRDDGSPDAPRTSEQVLRENMSLKIQLANLRGQLQHLQEREAQLAVMGEVRDLCTPFGVAGADSGPRESLMLTGSSFAGLREGMPVLSTDRGLIGRIARVGVGEARVQLVTDRQFRVTAVFAQYVKKPDGSVEYVPRAAEPFLLEGAGGGEMSVSNMPIRKAEEIGVQLNDWVVLNDREWTEAEPLRHYHIGYVVSISPSRKAGFAEIRVRPSQNLRTLREVMVLNKTRG